MNSFRNILRLAAFIAVTTSFLSSCETIKGASQGAVRGAKKDVGYVVEAAKGETEEPQGLGIAVDAVKKTDQWIKDNMW